MSDIKTLREASHIVAGINTRLSLMTGVFVVCTGLGGAAFWNLNTRIDSAISSISDIRVAVSAQTEQLKSANQKLSEIAVSLRADSHAPGAEKAARHVWDGMAVGIGGIDPQVLTQALEQASSSSRPDQIFSISSSNPLTLQALAKALGVPVVDQQSIPLQKRRLAELPQALTKLTLNITDNVSLSSSDEEAMQRLAAALQPGR